MKRSFDIFVSAAGLFVFAPVLLVVMFLVWRQDRCSPFYIAPRVGKNKRLFKMVKLRSMIANADASGVDSTSGDDARITPVGHLIRRYKLDEVTQLWNVLKGDMSLVGPRPNVKRETKLYTEEENRLLSVRPGITDFASIVFADEGEILEGKEDPDLAYNQLIRPYKSRLGLFYIDQKSVFLDFSLCYLTVVAILSRRSALDKVARMIETRGGEGELVHVARRLSPLVAAPPPGSSSIVTSRT